MSAEAKVITITGATKGIGLALVKWFVQAGHKVLGCGRSVDQIQKLNATYESAGSKFTVVDVSNMKSVEDWAKQSISEYGPPDLLINNAAIPNKPNRLWNVPLEEFDKIIDVNLKGMNYVIHYFVPAMIKAQKGIIINVSSGWGRSTAADTAPYCCTKFGVEGLSLALAQELPPPLACAPMNPGVINTEMLEVYFEDQAKLHRGPEEWAKTAGPFLLSLDRSINGKKLTAP